MQNPYRRIDASLREVRSSGQNDVRLTAIKSSREEYQTYYCQHQSINFGDKFQTANLRMKNKGQANCYPHIPSIAKQPCLHFPGLSSRGE